MDDPQGTNTNQDPLAPFSGNQQPQEQFEFAGQKWESKQAAELAYQQYIGSLNAKATEAAAAAQAAQQQAQQQTRSAPQVTGNEPIGFSQDKYLEYLRESGERANNYAIFGNPDSPVTPRAMFQTLLASQIQQQKVLDDMRLRQNHPEINWDDEKQVGLINQTIQERGLAQNFDGRDMAIAYLAYQGKVPHRAQYIAAMQQRAQEQQQQVVQQAAQQAQDPFGNNVYTMPQPQVGPPQYGRINGSVGGVDINRVFARMDDDNTPLTEAQKLHQALVEYLERNPQAARAVGA